MKKILQLNPLLILVLTYLPSLALRLLSRDQAYNPIDRSTLFLLSSVWLTACQTAWIWAAGTELSNKNKPLNINHLTIFKGILLIPIAYVILPLGTLTNILIPINLLFPFLTFEFYSYWHIVSLLCFIYPIYYIAKSLTSIELNKPTVFSEYINTFLAIVFFPIGIFLIQPRIKKVVNSIVTNHQLD